MSPRDVTRANGLSFVVANRGDVLFEGNAGDRTVYEIFREFGFVDEEVFDAKTGRKVQDDKLPELGDGYIVWVVFDNGSNTVVEMWF